MVIIICRTEMYYQAGSRPAKMEVELTIKKNGTEHNKKEFKEMRLPENTDTPAPSK